MNRDYRAKGVDARIAAWQHSIIDRHTGFFPRDMMNTSINQPTKARRAAFASCHAQGSKRLAMDCAVSGRTAE